MWLLWTTLFGKCGCYDNTWNSKTWNGSWFDQLSGCGQVTSYSHGNFIIFYILPLKYSPSNLVKRGTLWQYSKAITFYAFLGMYVSHNSTPPALTNSLWIMDLGYSNQNQIEKPTQSGDLSGDFSTTSHWGYTMQKHSGNHTSLGLLGVPPSPCKQHGSDTLLIYDVAGQCNDRLWPCWKQPWCCEMHCASLE